MNYYMGDFFGLCDSTRELNFIWLFDQVDSYFRAKTWIYRTVFFIYIFISNIKMCVSNIVQVSSLPIQCCLNVLLDSIKTYTHVPACAESWLSAPKSIINWKLPVTFVRLLEETTFWVLCHLSLGIYLNYNSCKFDMLFISFSELWLWHEGIMCFEMILHT